jgi:MOSC domain-containing protein YiiM
MSMVLQVNLAVPERTDVKGVGVTGINKQPVTHPVEVTAPGPKNTAPPSRASGLAGDEIHDLANHGGTDQAVYAYAREDYEWWEKELDRPLPGGIFGENLTTSGIDINATLLGSRWRIGSALVLETTFGRIPCATFQWKMQEPRWVKRFSQEARPGVYFRVVTPGPVQQGDEITVLHEPAQGVTVAESFRAWLFEPAALEGYLALDGVPETLKADIRRRLRL